jgi:hypothetical protein
MYCQLEDSLDSIARELTFRERLSLRTAKLRRRSLTLLAKLFSPSVLSHKLRRVIHLPVAAPNRPTPAPAAAAQPDELSPRLPPLRLQPGERVRVKSWDQVLQTLDPSNRYEGCSFTSVMRSFCGQTCIVRRRVELFFDERRYKMLKAKNMVILENVFCQTSPDGHQAFGGCDRSCYLFWKEAWLERVPPVS